MRVYEIITEEVKMPENFSEWRFKKDKVKNRWVVIDTHNDNAIVTKRAFEDCCIICYNLNKKFYRDGKI